MTSKILQWVKLTLLVLLLVVVLVFAYNFIGHQSLFGWNLFNVQNNFGEGELILTESFDADVEKIDVNMLFEAVSIEEYNGDKIEVEYYSTIDDSAYYPTFVTNGDTFSATQAKRVTMGILSNGKIIIRVPQDKLYDYDISSTSGSVKLYAAANDIKCKSTSGSVKVMLGGQNAIVSSTSGSVHVYGAFKTLDASSTSGSVRAVADENTTSIKATSTSGSVKIEIDGNVGYTATCSTTSGSIRDEYQGTKYDKNTSFKVGNGAMKIEASTVSGSVRLEDWAD